MRFVSLKRKTKEWCEKIISRIELEVSKKFDINFFIYKKIYIYDSYKISWSLDSMHDRLFFSDFLFNKLIIFTTN